MTEVRKTVDDIYNDQEAVREAIKDLTWHNARVDRLFIGYEDHGILTMSIGFDGDGWSQGFHNRSLTTGDSFRNYIEGWLKLMPIEGAKGTLVQVGKAGDTFHADLVAVRPILDSSPVFWPGGEPNLFYVFNSSGEVMKPGFS